MRTFLSIWLVLCFSFALRGQNTFNRFYGTVDSEYGTDVLQTIDGGYMQIIQTQFAGNQLPVLVKTDCRGFIEWTNGVLFDNQTSSYCMINAKGNSVTILFNYREPITGNYLTAITNIALNGNIVWCKKIPMECGFLNGGIIQENSGNFLVCGNSHNAPGASPVVGIAKIDALGNLLEQTEINFPQPVNVFGITALPNGDYALTGNYPSSLPTFKDIYVMTVSNDLTFKKAVILDTYYDDEPSAITSDVFGKIYICGRSYFIGSQWDAMLLKFDTDLNLVFSKYYDAATTEGEVFRHIIATRDNNLALCGDIGAFDERNPAVTKMDNNGNIIFNKEYPMSPMFTNYFYKINETREGGFVTTGDIRPPSSLRDGAIIKLDKYGNDHCYAQDFWFTITNQPASLSNVIGVNALSAITCLDTLPDFVNVPIHNVENCSTTGPCPGFSSTVEDGCNAHCFDFTNESSFATVWNWTFEDGNPATSNLEDPKDICFNSPGLHDITLTISDGMDTSVLVKQVEVKFDCDPVIPNVFTPNGDGINDVFEILGLPASYSLNIFNRWGNQVYAVIDLPTFWNGTVDAKKVSQGVYYYAFENTLTGKQYKGFIEIVY